MKIKLLICAVIPLLLVGCAGSEKKMPDTPPEELYKKAHALIEKKEWTESAKYFDEVERQHPYSIWASRGQVMQAYALYQKGAYNDAVLVLDRFLQMHPGSSNAPYALYLKGLCYFNQISDIGREQKVSADAQETFLSLVSRYPKSIYVNDALYRLGIIQDQLAGKEMEIGRYYERQKDYLPAMNRFQTVIDTYPNSLQIPEALYRLCSCYVALGMKSEANAVRKEMEQKYADTKWTRLSKELVNEAKEQKK